MPLDPSLLGQTRAAQSRLIEAEHDAEIARGEFHGAVRRLQLAGGSLREIAEELGLSHQRAHQIVEASGGSRSWRGGRAGAPELTCSFCGKNQKQVEKLIAGPSVYVCDGCIGRVHSVLAAADKTVSTSVATIQQVSDEVGAGSCSFCGKARHRVESMAEAGDARICNECVELCDEIISEST